MDDLLTAREVQDLLKIDRTTVYRMLNDGRLRGVKVGQQWRFPRPAIDRLLGEAPVESPPPSPAPAPLPEQLPLHCIQAIQDVFAELAGVSALTTDANGTPLTATSQGCRFCALIQSSPAGRAACQAEWASLAARSTPAPGAATCHAGLSYRYGLIKLDAQPLATLIGGQFREAEQPVNLADLAARYQLDPELLAAALAEVPCHNAEMAARIEAGLVKVAATFATITQERTAMLTRLRQIAALSSVA